MRKLKIRRRENGKAGFTLVEILVAVTVAIALLSIMASILGNLLSVFQKRVNTSVAEHEATSAFELLGDDMERLLYQKNSNAESLRCTLEQVNGVQVQWLTFITSSRDIDTSGTAGFPRAVSYRIAYQDSITTGGRYPTFALYRTVADAKTTLQQAIGLADLQADFWQSGTSTTSAENFLAGQVIEFNLRFLLSNGNWISLTTPGDFFQIVGSGVCARANGQTQSNLGDVICAEMEVTVLTSQGATLTQNTGMPITGETLARYSQKLTRRISLKPRLLAPQNASSQGGG